MYVEANYVDKTTIKT